MILSLAALLNRASRWFWPAAQDVAGRLRAAAAD